MAMTLFQDINACTPQAGVLTIRVQPETPAGHNILFVGGVFIGASYDWTGDGLSDLGYPVRVNRVLPDWLNEWFEIDLDTKDFPDGVYPLYAMLLNGDDTLRLEMRGELRIENGLPLTTQTVALAKPHFGTTGLLSSYDSEKSFFPRIMFGTSIEEFNSRPGLLEAYKAAGFNTIHPQIGRNTVRDTNGACTQEEFEAAQRLRVDVCKAFCEAHHVKCLAGMDDWTWSVNQYMLMLEKPWIEQAIKNTFVYMRNAGCFVGIDLKDETEYEWSLHDTRGDLLKAFHLSIWAHEAKGPPVSWTTIPINHEFPNYRYVFWAQGQTYSDYLSLGRDLVDFRKSLDPSVDQFYRAMFGSAYKVRTDCPFLINVSCCGQENVPDYHVLAEIGYAVALGAVGIKVYHLDTQAWKTYRQQNPGGPYVQYGCDPETFPSRWQAMSHAMNAVAELEPLILQPQVECQTGGRWFATRAWGGDNGKLWLAVNRLTISQTAVLPRGYSRGYTLGADGKTAISAKSKTAMVQPGGWAVLKTEIQ